MVFKSGYGQNIFWGLLKTHTLVSVLDILIHFGVGSGHLYTDSLTSSTGDTDVQTSGCQPWLYIKILK